MPNAHAECWPRQPAVLPCKIYGASAGFIGPLFEGLHSAIQPKKGVNKEYKEIFPNFSLKFRVLKLRFFALSEGPGGFRELREAGRNHFHLSG